MTLDEAINKNIKMAELQERLLSNADDSLKEIVMKYAAEYRQLAEWLTELNDSRAVQNEQEIFIHELMGELEEAKRLLKAAVEDIRYLINHAKRNGKACDRCKYGNEMYCYADDCSNDAKWQHEAEALALIGKDTNVPAREDGEQNG